MKTKTKTKMFALLLGTSLAVTSFTGCGNQAEDGGTGEEDPQEIVEIVAQICTLTEPGDGFYKMEDALNEMLEKDIGVHVTFERTDVANCTTDATLAVSSGEQMDVIISFGTAAQTWDSGMCIALDDLAEQYAPDALEQMGDYVAQCKIDGQLVGLTVTGVNADGYGYQMKKSIADKYGFTRDVDKLYTFDELEDMFQTIEDGEGQPMLMQVSTASGSMGINNAFCFDNLGKTYFSYGGLMLNNNNYDPTEVVNIYATPEYADYAERMYQWAQKGWISADAAVTTDSADEICTRDDVVGMLAYGSFDERLNQTVSWSDEIVVFNMQPSVTMGSLAGMMWHVTPNCEHPEKAVEFLNYFYKNPDAYTLVQYGFEGEEWEVVEEEGDKKLVRWMSDNPVELPYYIAYPWIGNQLSLPVFEPNPIDMNEIKQAIEKENTVSPALGFVFDESEYSTEVSAINAVVEKYSPSINAGAVDPAGLLPEFLSELEAAGMNDVIAACQEQLDAFIAENS
ncbi:ABC transporter substrate-binding protein [Lachnoclostridium sp. An169]|uniref:ABC transporter substrate-binding protein n=1 Tax=Lachnoclostridium sp. An169 TaxID=1965569 RepID=UPI0013A61013|nr:ABC transporter substrate-binding protein [Lachnoclostridium sp. An169]